MKLEDLLKLAPVDLEKTADAMTTPERREAREILEQIAQKAASFSAYFDAREGYGCGDQGHKSGVKEFNRVLKKVRQAFGYTITRPLSF